MVANPRLYTYADLLQMPDDGKRREIIGGELFVRPAPRRNHQEISANLHVMLAEFLRRSHAGRAYFAPVDVYVGVSDVVEPDLIVIRESRLDIYRPEGVVVEPPDIVIEVISPSSQRIDRVSKMALYERFGVPEYWIVGPVDRTLTIYKLVEERYVSVEAEADGTVCSAIFPGLCMDPDAVFAGLVE